MKALKRINDLIYSLLRKTEKYTGTDMIYLAKGSFWLTLGQIISIAASFSLAIAFANLLDPTTYGNYSYILSLVGVLSIFTISGMGTAITQATARGLEGSFYTGFNTRLKWGFLASSAAIGLAGYYWLQGNYLLPIPLLISAIFLPLMQASRLYESFLAGRKLFHIQAKYNAFNRIVSAGAIITTLFITKNIFWLIAIYLVSHTFLNYFFYLITKSKFKPNKKEDPQTISYGKHLSVMSVISTIADYLDRILLFTLVGSAQLAIYSFAILIPDQLKSLIKQNVSTLAFPKLSIKSREEIKLNIMKKFWKLLFLTGVITVIYIIIAPFLYKTVLPQYLDSISYSQLFAFSFMAVPTTLLVTVFQAKMRKKELYLIKMIIPIVRIILLLFLTPVYGIWGVVIGQVGAGFSYLALTLFLFRKF
ncbi:MAG: oligosaccharide flippase family protein [Patescibacteria group bacterium]|nr:oligosaccharide flippase family protein [Patescibacteria group bacterium]